MKLRQTGALERIGRGVLPGLGDALIAHVDSFLR
jgi:hypothetical protein